MKEFLLELEDAKSTRAIKSILALALYNVADIVYDAPLLIQEKNTKYVECRYYAVNLHAFMSMGTLEFRHHEGAIDTNIIKWPLFSLYYTHYSTRVNAWSKWRGATLSDFVEKVMPVACTEWYYERLAKYKDEWTKKTKAATAR